MMTEGPSPTWRTFRFSQLSPDQARSIDEICDYFEHQLYVHGRPRIEGLLGGFAKPERFVLLRELLLLELETYLARDTLPSLQAYRRRFPEDQDLIDDVFEAVFPQAALAEPASAEPGPDIPNYRVLREVGHGGMGRVYEAIHIKLGMRVALKVLRADLATDLEAEASFEREMKAIGALAHPNIVGARDAGKSSGRHYLVMDYVEGLDLETLLQRLGTLPVADACEIARRVALALQHAYEHGLVHRDIKPKNILLGRCPPGSGEVEIKVVDFGVASLRGYAALRDPAVQYARVVGTFAYMAPEQFWDQTADVRSDIYSLGCTLYCLLLGRPPFSRPQYQDSAEIMAAHRSTRIPSFRRVRPDVPEPLEKLVLTMLAKDPRHRYETPADLAQSLADFAEEHDLANLLGCAESLPALVETPHAAQADGPSEVAPPNEPVRSPELFRRRRGAEEHKAETVDYVGPKPLVVAADVLPDARQGGPAVLQPEVQSREPEAVRKHEKPSRRRWLVYGVSGVVALSLLILAGIWRAASPRPVAVDLLAQIDPGRDAVESRWHFDDQVLVSPDAPYGRLQVPCSLPEQYRLEIEAHRVSGGRLVIGLPWQGRQLPFVLDTAVIVPGSSAAESTGSNPPSIPPEFEFTGAPAHTYTCIVRREGIVVAYEDRVEFTCLAGDQFPQRDPQWQTGNRKALFIGTHNSVYRFNRLVLTPLSR